MIGAMGTGAQWVLAKFPMSVLRQYRDSKATVHKSGLRALDFAGRFGEEGATRQRSLP
tara:strand:- start:537 stop:710 length:174 start_codon:yes stop_codon:yes gene_type:complete